MAIKFSEDIVPLADVKVNPGKVVRRTKDSHRPILLTSRGRAVVDGMSDLDNNRQIDLDTAKKRLDL